MSITQISRNISTALESILYVGHATGERKILVDHAVVNAQRGPGQLILKPKLLGLGIFTDFLVEIEQFLLQAVIVGLPLRIRWKEPKVVHTGRNFEGDCESLSPQALIGSRVGKGENPFQLLVADAFQPGAGSKSVAGLTQGSQLLPGKYSRRQEQQGSGKYECH